MKKKRFLRLIGISFLLFVQFSVQSVSQDKVKSQARVTKKTSKRTSPSENFIERWRRKKEDPKSKGVLLRFHSWPSKKQARAIINRLRRSGLKRTKTIERFKVWVFDWEVSTPDELKKSDKKFVLKPAEEATAVCERLPELSILKYCESDTLLYPASTDNQTEAGAGCMNEECLRGSGSQELSDLSHVINRSNEKEESCELVSSKHKLMDSTLSDYWAQELIGSDLLREELEKIPHPEKKNYIAVFDSRQGNDVQNDMNSHAVIVRNLISNEGTHAVLPELNDKISIFETFSNSAYLATADLLIRDEVPAFINNSMTWGNKLGIYEAFESMSPPAIIVTASGNNFPVPLGKMKDRASKGFNIITVGSLSPGGFVSDFSQSGEEVHILAPSDDYITSAKADGSYMQFGGTSGASPLVTGSLASFEWLSGYHPTAEEAKLLLEKTALPTLHIHEEPQTNGAGLLNAYKLGMMGKRLKEKCQDKDSSCFHEEIKKEENYVFEVDEENLESNIAITFSSCSRGRYSNSAPRIGCEDKQRVLRELRRAILLVPERRDLWETLSCIYKSEGFSQNGKVVDRIALSLGSREEIFSELNTLGITTGIRLVRGLKGEEGFQFLRDLLKSRGKSDIIKIEVALAAGDLGGAEGFQLLQTLSEDESASVRQGVVSAAGDLGGAEGFQLLQTLSEDESAAVRQGMASAAVNLGGAEGFQLLQTLSEGADDYVRMQVAKVAGSIGGPKGAQLLQTLSEDANDYVRRAVGNAAGSMGGLEGIQLLKQLSEDVSDYVRRGVGNAAGSIGGPEGMKLLEDFSEDTDADIRRGVAKVVAHMDGSEGVQLLKQLSKDENEYVREWVAFGAGRMGGLEGVGLLETLSKDENADVREWVVIGAGDIGGAEGMRLLEALSKDEVENIREKANKQLERLRPE